MDKIRNIQISLIVVGLFLIVVPFSIAGYSYTFNRVRALVWGMGVVFVLIGITYRRSVQYNRNRHEDFERRKGLPKTNGEIVGYIGLLLFFAGLGVGAINSYVVKMNSLIALFLLLIVVGVILVFIANIMVREERRKEREKAKYGH
jgi:peptidoglycan/LPS O-acetylase OafA/YrhL